MHLKKQSQKEAKQSPKDEENQVKYGLIKIVNFIITLLKIFLKINNIEMYSTYKEGKFVIAERFIRTLKNKNF